MNLTRNNNAIKAFAGLVLSLGYFCCGGNPTSPEVGNPEELIVAGWAAFEAGDFGSAVVKFDSAKLADAKLVEAYNGAGWAYGRLSDFELASDNFRDAMALDSALVEAHAGASLAFHAANHFAQSIEEAIFTLESEPNFVFSHDPSVDSLDIRITLALSYFSVADFVSAAVQMDILDPFNRPHSTDPEELIREIMRLFGQID